MSDPNTKKSDTIKTKLPQLDDAVEQIELADLDEVAGGLAGEDCKLTCKDSKITFAVTA